MSRPGDVGPYRIDNVKIITAIANTIEGSLGKKRSAEGCKNISNSLKGAVFSEKHKTNLSKSLKGRRFTEKWRRKISEAMKGNKNGGPKRGGPP